MAIKKKSYFYELIKNAIYFEGKRIIEQSVTKEIEEQQVLASREKLLKAFDKNLEKISSKVVKELEKQGVTIDTITNVEDTDPAEKAAKEIQRQIEEELKKL